MNLLVIKNWLLVALSVVTDIPVDQVNIDLLDTIDDGAICYADFRVCNLNLDSLNDFIILVKNKSWYLTHQSIHKAENGGSYMALRVIFNVEEK